MLGTDIRYCFFGLCFCSVLFLLGVGDKHALVLHDILCCSSVIFRFLIFFVAHDSRGQRKVTRPGSCVVLLTGRSSRFFKLLRLVSLFDFLLPFSLRIFDWLW